MQVHDLDSVAGLVPRFARHETDVLVLCFDVLHVEWAG